MALLHCEIHSEILQKQTQFRAILPQTGDDFPVLYLLHGLGDDSSSWTRFTQLESWANEYGIAVMMPDAERSFYADMAFGGNYYTYIQKEFPQICESMFRIGRLREKRFIAGLSMGGYGAVKLALREPDRYRVAGSFSGAFDIELCHTQVTAQEWQAIFGKRFITETENDIHTLLNKCEDFAALPLFHLSCGSKDAFAFSHKLFYKNMLKWKLMPELFLDEGYAHTWPYWNICIERFLRYLREESMI